MEGSDPWTKIIKLVIRQRDEDYRMRRIKLSHREMKQKQANQELKNVTGDK